MTGGLIQLVAYGVQDVVLSGSPQITYFKGVHKRHTNFSMEEFEQAFSGPLDFASRNDVKIARRGDLITNMTLEFDLKPNTLNSSTYDFDTMATKLANITYMTQKHQRYVADETISTPTITAAQAQYLLHIPIDHHINPRFTQYASRTGHILVDWVELEIGGQQIDKQYGEWLEIWSQLTESAQKQVTLDQMVSIDNSQDGRIYVPLRFWFCNNPGLALPLVALQYHDVIMYLNLCNKQSLQSDYYNYISALETISAITTGSTGDTLGDAIVTQLAALFTAGDLPTTAQLDTMMGIERIALFVNYIYLDTDERRRFAQMSHEYLITQLQLNTSNTVPAGGNRINIELNFNHPVKELIWTVQNIGNRGDDRFNYWNGKLPGPTENPYLSSSQNAANRLGDQVKNTLLLLNGTERFQQRRGAYFRLVQPYYFNTGGANFLCQNMLMGKPGMAMYVAQAMTQNLTNITEDGTAQGAYSTNRLLSAGKTAQGGFYNYSFGLHPEENQPSGTCNFSRLDTSTLILDLYPSNDGSGSSISRGVNIYALNYNILRVMNGMGGIAYAN